jgi:hypothetical protein
VGAWSWLDELTIAIPLSILELTLTDFPLMPNVFRVTLEQHKIFGPVVSLNTIDVMNTLIRKERTPEFAFHDVTMFHYMFLRTISIING